MAKKRLDVKTKAPDGFYEYSMMKGVEMVTIEDRECLWQEFVGELKTNKGTLLGCQQGEYGSNLPQLLGQNMDLALEMEIEDCVQSTAQDYVEIFTSSVQVVENETNEKKGIITLRIELNTLYGLILKIEDFQKGC